MMRQIAQLYIDGKKIDNPVQNAFPVATTDLAGVVSNFLRVTILVAAMLMVVWAAWGVFQYIFSGGNKDAVKKAQGRITWALVGFIILISAYSISGFIQQLATHK